MGTTTRVTGLPPDALGRFRHILTLSHDSGREAAAGFCIPLSLLYIWD